MVLRDADRRGDTQFDLAVPGDRGLPPPWSWNNGGSRAGRGPAPVRRGPAQTAGGAAVGKYSTVVAWQRDLDVLIGRSLVPFRIDQVSLQLCLLGEDDVAVPGAPLYVHVSPPRDANGPDL